MAVNLVQALFRFRTDGFDVDDSRVTWGANENVNFNPAVGDNFRLRFRLDNTGTTSTAKNYTLWRSVDGGAYAPVSGTYITITDASNSLSADGDPITINRLTGGSGTAYQGVYSYSSFSLTTPGTSYREIEWGLELNTTARGHTIDFRMYADSVPLNSYTVTPRVTVPAPALTAVNAVSGSPVLGAPAMTVIATVNLTALPLSANPPVLGTPLALTGRFAVPINVGSPVLGTPTWRHALTALNFSVSAPQLPVTNTFTAVNLAVGRPVFDALLMTLPLPAPVSKTVGSPIFSLPKAGLVFHPIGFEVGSPEIPVLELYRLREPHAHMAIDDMRSPDGEAPPGQPNDGRGSWSIHANYNNAIIMEMQGSALAGRAVPDWGIIQSIRVKQPLRLQDGWLSLDSMAAELQVLRDMIEQNTKLLLQISNIPFLQLVGDKAEKIMLARNIYIGSPVFGIPVCGTLGSVSLTVGSPYISPTYLRVNQT